MSAVQLGPDSTSVMAGPPSDWLQLFRRFFQIAGGFWGSGNWAARGLLAALVILTAAQVAIQVALNLWTERLFSAFGAKSIDLFLLLAAAFLTILLADIVIITSHLCVRRRLQINWRRWLTQRLSGEWMASGRHYHMSYMPGDHDNPDGRISEDLRIATEAAVDLGHSLLYCVMLLASFIHILWILSSSVTLSLGAVEIEVPGHLVWIALVYAAIGGVVALSLGPRLVTTAEARQTYEANFRFGLVHARENAAAIALVHGEGGERRRFRALVQEVVEAWDRQTGALFRFYVFSSAWSVLSPIFPILIAAPRYIAGTITLGALMQIAQAFQQAIGALSWPIDNLSAAAAWRASVERILGLRAGIAAAKETGWCTDCARIDVAGAGAPRLTLQAVTIVNPAGEIVVEDLSADIFPGQQIWLWAEPPGASAIIKALAGLWRSGRGRIELPTDGPLYFMPQKPYLPLAPLRDVVSYPATTGAERDAEIIACLRSVDLDHLIGKLHDAEVWEETLSLGEQQRLGFARLLFHRPSWIILEQPADALSGAGERDMMQLLRKEFPAAALVVAGQSAPAGIDWTRVAVSSASLPRRATTAV